MKTTEINDVKYRHKGVWFTEEFLYHNNGDLTVINSKMTKRISKSDMQTIANDYKGANRIYKPMALLFWTDCKNGNFKDWEEEK